MTGSHPGRVLIAGTASLLICLFLSPKFIEFLRHREFGQNIREEGPQGHQTKAGTPTMGGIIIFLAIAIPYVLLSKRDWQSLGVFFAAIACALLGFADDYTKIVKRRSLGLRARTKLGVTIAISLGLWWIATQKANIGPTIRAPIRRRLSRPGAAVPGVHLPRGRRDHHRRQLHRRPRRAGGRVRGDRSARLHRHHVHHRRARISPCWPAAWWARASASSGSTASPPASSWGTPVRSGSAARSRASRS